MKSRGSHRLAKALVVLGALLSLSETDSAWAGRDVKAAQVEIDEAKLAMAGKRYVEAAEHMEKAFAFDPNPLWLANAGYARMLAGQQDRAVESLSAALADRNLEGDSRTRAVERLGKASAAKAFIARSEESKTQGDLVGAARAYDEAYSAVPIGPYALEAATLWERAGEFKRAEERYNQAAAAQDLTPEQQRQTVDSLARVARLAAEKPIEKPDHPIEKPDHPTEKPPDTANVTNPEKPPETPAEGGGSSVLGWVLTGTGAAATIGGVVILIIGNGKASDLQKAQDDAAGGRVESMSRAEAQALASDADTFQTVGVVTAIAGVAIAATGTVLVLTSGPSGPTTRSSVKVGAGPTRGGWGLTLGGEF